MQGIGPRPIVSLAAGGDAFEKFSRSSEVVSSIVPKWFKRHGANAANGSSRLIKYKDPYVRTVGSEGT